jgi:hypothetical protein
MVVVLKEEHKRGILNILVESFETEPVEVVVNSDDLPIFPRILSDIFAEFSGLEHC